MRRMLTLSILGLALTIPAFGQQQCPQKCQQQINDLQAAVQQLQTTVTQLQTAVTQTQQQVPVFAAWPDGVKKAFPFQNPASKDQTSDPFQLPYTPHFALVSFIAVRERGSGVGDQAVHTPVLLVSMGEAAEFASSDTGCRGMKMSLVGKSLRLQHDCQDRMYGGYPAFNIEFLP